MATNAAAANGSIPGGAVSSGPVSNTSISRRRRVAYAALSGLSGWLVAQIVCLPVNLITAVRDSEGQAKLFVQTLFYGLLVWGGWTFFLALAAWLLVVLPLVMTIRPCLLVRLRFAILSAALAIALLLAARRPAMFHEPHVTFLHKFWQFLPYGGFAASFTLVTAWMYILLSKRRIEGASAN